MSDLNLAKPKQKTLYIARKMAGAAKNEIEAVTRSAGTQITSSEMAKEGRPSPIVEAMRQGTSEVSDSDHAGIHTDENRKLDYLEKELEELRRKNETKTNQDKLSEKSVSQEKPTLILQEPTTKRKKGLFGVKAQAQKKQGTREMGKQVSG